MNQGNIEVLAYKGADTVPAFGIGTDASSSCPCYRPLGLHGAGRFGTQTPSRTLAYSGELHRSKPFTSFQRNKNYYPFGQPNLVRCLTESKQHPYLFIHFLSIADSKSLYCSISKMISLRRVGESSSFSVKASNALPVNAFIFFE